MKIKCVLSRGLKKKLLQIIQFLVVHKYYLLQTVFSQFLNYFFSRKNQIQVVIEKQHVLKTMSHHKAPISIKFK